MADRDKKKYQYFLHHLPGVGDRTIEKLLREFGSAKEVYYATEAALGKIIEKKEQLKIITDVIKTWELEKEYEKLEKRGIHFYTGEDPEYPAKLRHLPHPPYGIYCLGRMPDEKLPSVAMIGARECSAYGSCMAEAFGGAMARAGVQVISGMARGIDSISQRAALQNDGKTWAVLGCGVDICYPASNRSLYQEIINTGGGVLSVVPPGTEPMKRLFPERNRIVAGLCDALLVVEARQKSGTWITVDMALEQGKSIYAIPGRLTDRLSDGCNMLIRQGAGIALSPEDILKELSVMKNRKGNDESFTGQEEKITHGILRYLDFSPKSIDEIMEEMKGEGEERELTELLTELVSLCLCGRARQIAGSYYVKIGG